MSRYLFDEMALAKQIIILLSVIQASEANHTFLGGHEGLGMFYSEWNIIQENIISTAIQLRIIDDIYNENKQTYLPIYKSVGKLKEDSKELPLKFRESFNKIVHAKRFEPLSLAELENHPSNHESSFVRPVVSVYGEKKEKTGGQK